MIGIKANSNYEKYEWKRIVIFKKISFLKEKYQENLSYE